MEVLNDEIDILKKAIETLGKPNASHLIEVLDMKIKEVEKLHESICALQES